MSEIELLETAQLNNRETAFQPTDAKRILITKQDILRKLPPRAEALS